MQYAQATMRHSFCKATDCRHDGGTGRDLRARKGIVKRRGGRGQLCLSPRFPGPSDPFDGGDPHFLRAGRLGVLGRDKGRKVRDCLVLVKAEIVVEKEEQLLFHEVHLCEIEEGGISRPVLVFGRGVVEVFRSNDEGRQEDAVTGTRHACQSGHKISRRQRGDSPLAMAGSLARRRFR